MQGVMPLAKQSKWTVISFDDFNDPMKPTEWSFSEYSTCQNKNDYFLGGPCKLSSQEVTKTITNIPSHSKVFITANLHFIDKWEGESAFVKVDGKTVWMKSVKGGDMGVDLCGDENVGEAAYNVSVMVETMHD
jgi:hypothetical protein